MFLISHTNSREKYDLLVTKLAFPNWTVARETAWFLFGQTWIWPELFKCYGIQKAQNFGDFRPNIFPKLLSVCVCVCVCVCV